MIKGVHCVVAAAIGFTLSALTGVAAGNVHDLGKMLVRAVLCALIAGAIYALFRVVTVRVLGLTNDADSTADSGPDQDAPGSQVDISVDDDFFGAGDDGLDFNIGNLEDRVAASKTGNGNSEGGEGFDAIPQTSFDPKKPLASDGALGDEDDFDLEFGPRIMPSPITGLPSASPTSYTSAGETGDEPGGSSEPSGGSAGFTPRPLDFTVPPVRKSEKPPVVENLDPLAAAKALQTLLASGDT
jgi:hypothetical protein